MIERIRNFLRRLLGIQNFETLMLAELRARDELVTRWMCDLPTTGRLRYTERRLTSTREELQELGILVRRYTEALGPMWTTAQGHTRPMGLLSSLLLRNILEGGFARNNYTLIHFAERELARRSIDAKFRAEEAPTREQMKRVCQTVAEQQTTSGTGDLSAVAEATFQLKPPTRFLPRETRLRVVRVLPQWAQDLIKELL